jgi:hypothetical protein
VTGDRLELHASQVLKSKHLARWTVSTTASGRFRERDVSFSSPDAPIPIEADRAVQFAPGTCLTHHDRRLDEHRKGGGIVFEGPERAVVAERADARTSATT